MKPFTLEQAQEIVGDPEAIKRGYINPQTLIDAEILAKEVIEMPTFGQMGYLGEVGGNHPWWSDNCKAYAEFAVAERYSKARQFSKLLQITEAMVADDRREIMEARWMALKILRKQGELEKDLAEEYQALNNCLEYAAKI